MEPGRGHRCFFSISFPRITILRDGLISRSLEIANSFPRYSNSRERNSYLDSRRNKILFSENEIRGSIKIVIRGNEIEKKTTMSSPGSVENS